MAWTYNDWDSQTTTAAQLTRLKLHKTEVAAAIQADVGADGYSRSSGSLTQYYDSLQRKVDELEKRPDASGTVAGGFSHARLNRRL